MFVVRYVELLLKSIPSIYEYIIHRYKQIPHGLLAAQYSLQNMNKNYTTA